MDEKAVLEQYRQRWIPAPLEPVSPAEKLAKSFHEFEELKRQILTPADTYQGGDQAVRIRKSGWRKLALAFGLSDEIVDEIQEKDEKDPKTWVWHVRVRVTSRAGRTVEGVSSCSTRERVFAHPDHDTHALAHTRAKSRAIADMLGAGDLIAEEFEEEPSATKESMPQKTQPPSGGPEAEEAVLRTVPWQKAREFLTRILGESIMEHVGVHDEGGLVVAYLDSSVQPSMRTEFLERLYTWGYLAKESDKGLRVVIRDREL